MAVGTGQIDRVVGGHRVQLLLGGVVGVLPNGVHPAPALNPSAGLGLLGLGLHSLQNDVLGLPEGVDNQQALTQAIDVHMALNQAGNDRLAAQVGNLGVGADVGLHTGLAAYINQAVALDGQGGGGGEGLVHRVNVAVAVHTVGGHRFRRKRQGGEQGNEHYQCQEHCRQSAKSFAHVFFLLNCCCLPPKGRPQRVDRSFLLL